MEHTRRSKVWGQMSTEGLIMAFLTKILNLNSNLTTQLEGFLYSDLFKGITPELILKLRGRKALDHKLLGAQSLREGFNQLSRQK